MVGLRSALDSAWFASVRSIADPLLDDQVQQQRKIRGGSSTRHQRVNVGECTARVQTNLEFDLEVQHPDQTTETKPYIISRLTRQPGGPLR